MGKNTKREINNGRGNRRSRHLGLPMDCSVGSSSVWAWPNVSGAAAVTDFDEAHRGALSTRGTEDRWGFTLASHFSAGRPRREAGTFPILASPPFYLRDLKVAGDGTVIRRPARRDPGGPLVCLAAARLRRRGRSEIDPRNFLQTLYVKPVCRPKKKIKEFRETFRSADAMARD